MPPTGQWPPPPQGPPEGPPQWNPQPGPPAQGGNKAKWILGGLVLLVVVVVTVVATLLVTRGSSGSSAPTASAPPSTSVDASDIASANDRGPAGIITEDPTCAAWGPINDTLAAEQRKGWDKRDPSIPEAEWSSAQREQFDAVARAMRSAADQTVKLAKRTPHRVMRELYEQSIAYSRKYADSIATYEPTDDNIAMVAVSASATVTWICAAISYGSAEARDPLVVRGIPPIQVSPVSDPSKPDIFLSSRDPVCADWAAMVSQFTADTDKWAQTTDPNVPASAWTPEVQAQFLDVMTTMQRNADEVDQLGIKSRNPTFADFASTAAQYRRAFVQSISSYTPADNYLESTSSQILALVNHACKAAGT